MAAAEVLVEVVEGVVQGGHLRAGRRESPPGSRWGSAGADAVSTQRAYEYAVELAVLQNLPTTPCCSQCTVRPTRSCRRWSAIPAIATLPGVGARALARSPNRPGERLPASADRVAGLMRPATRSAFQTRLPAPDAAIAGAPVAAGCHRA